jgi:hypothetical protein
VERRQAARSGAKIAAEIAAGQSGLGTAAVRLRVVSRDVV